MLSAQIDELRHKADMLRDHGTFIGYGGLTSTDPEMIECADLMCDAADTIWQLRDDLQRTNAENARLREVVADGELHAREILGENAKLQKAVDYLYGYARTCGANADDLLEFGVEVDE